MLDALKRLFGGTAAVPAPAPHTIADSAANDTPSELYRKAVFHCERGEVDAAERLLRNAIETQHDFAEAHFLLGQILQRRGQLEDASDCYVLATCFRPDLQEAYLQLGRIALDEGRFRDALEPLEKALALNAGDADAHNAMGAALVGLERIHEALDHYRKAVALRPGFADAHSNLGYVLFRDFERFEEGARHIQMALELAPENETALCNWTMVLQQQGRFAEAITLCDRLLAANPGLHEVRLNRSLVLLTRGEFERGWRDYEGRKHVRGYQHRALPWPEWDGSSLRGRNIYVCSEQGIGDEIMFASCLPEVISQAQGCVVECSPRLEKLFRRSFPSAIIVPKSACGRQIPRSLPIPVDCQSAIGSLPRFLRNAASEFPRRAGYMRADAERVAYWRNRLGELPGRLKIGISWRGGMKSTRQSLRSIGLEHWLPILHVKNTSFIDLQYTDCRAELAALKDKHGIEIVHWQEALDDYDETAALVSALDLIISVQTAVVHLSGALGKPVWVMVPVVPEWRYQQKGDSMLWYSSARLFRQSAPGEWLPVVDAVARDLQAQINFL